MWQLIKTVLKITLVAILVAPAALVVVYISIVIATYIAYKLFGWEDEE